MPASRPPPIACPTCRRRWYDDAYITSGFFGSSTRSVMPVFSLMVSNADHVFPPSVVLYNPRSPPGENSGPCAATYTTFELRGSITILPICSEVSSPTRFQVLPASVDLYTPSPKCALRWLWFSPVPNQTMFELRGSTSTQHRLNDGPASKMGSNVTPRFTVFHNPPNAVATYQTFGSFGSISTSAIRPVTSPGPMERKAIPLSLSLSSAAWATRSVGVKVVARNDVPRTARNRLRIGGRSGSSRQRLRSLGNYSRSLATLAGTAAPEEVVWGVASWARREFLRGQWEKPRKTPGTPGVRSANTAPNWNVRNATARNVRRDRGRDF